MSVCVCVYVACVCVHRPIVCMPGASASLATTPNPSGSQSDLDSNQPVPFTHSTTWSKPLDFRRPLSPSAAKWGAIILPCPPLGTFSKDPGRETRRKAFGESSRLPDTRAAILTPQLSATPPPLTTHTPPDMLHDLFGEVTQCEAILGQKIHFRIFRTFLMLERKL